MKRSIFCLMALALSFSVAAGDKDKKQVQPAQPEQKVYTISGTKEDMNALIALLQETNIRWKDAHPVIAGVLMQLQQQDNEQSTPEPAKPADTTSKK